MSMNYKQAIARHTIFIKKAIVGLIVTLFALSFSAFQSPPAFAQYGGGVYGSGNFSTTDTTSDGGADGSADGGADGSDTGATDDGGELADTGEGVSVLNTIVFSAVIILAAATLIRRRRRSASDEKGQ